LGVGFRDTSIGSTLKTIITKISSRCIRTGSSKTGIHCARITIITIFGDHNTVLNKITVRDKARVIRRTDTILWSVNTSINSTGINSTTNAIIADFGGLNTTSTIRGFGRFTSNIGATVGSSRAESISSGMNTISSIARIYCTRILISTIFLDIYATSSKRTAVRDTEIVRITSRINRGVSALTRSRITSISSAGNSIITI